MGLPKIYGEELKKDCRKNQGVRKLCIFLYLNPPFGAESTKLGRVEVTSLKNESPGDYLKSVFKSMFVYFYFIPCTFFGQ